MLPDVVEKKWDLGHMRRAVGAVRDKKWAI
jgi:hypothetical protein